MLLHVTDKWLKAIDEGKYTGAVFLDLAKAFGTVDHSTLCDKLSYYGFQGSSFIMELFVRVLAKSYIS